MPSKNSVRLGPVQETMLIPLLARALESRRRSPIVSDPKAIRIADSIDWDFSRFTQRPRVLACVLRTAIFDQWVRDFLQRHPAGTVVEIGAGLSSRFERLDNRTARWFDLDLPDAVALRHRYFRDSERHVTIVGSVLDSAWMEAVQRTPGPYLLLAEAVFVYLREPEVRAALAGIAAGFPGAAVAFDTASLAAIAGGNRDFARHHAPARFSWACDDPRTVEAWNIGLRLVESRTLAEVGGPARTLLSLPLRASLAILGALFPRQMGAYRINLFEAGPPL